MIKKLIEKIYLKYVIDSLIEETEMDKEDIKQAYVSLYENVRLMKLLMRMRGEDTKQLMKNEWRDEKLAAERYGKFKRVQTLIDKAKMYYQLDRDEKPDIDNTVKE
jgi:hypothetical protein